MEPSCRIKAVRAGRVPASSIRTVRIIGAERSLVVDGETIKLDELGPIILKEDGRLGRLSNWHEMTEPEQAATLRFVAKRNAKRRKALLKAREMIASGTMHCHRKLQSFFWLLAFSQALIKAL